MYKRCRSVRVSNSYSVFILCCPLGRNGQIYPIPSAFAQIPALHLARLRASSFFKPIFCLLDHLLLPGLLQSSLLSLTTYFKIQSNPQNTIINPPQHMPIPSTPFAVANQSIVSFNPNTSHLFFSRLSVNNFLTAHGSHHSP